MKSISAEISSDELKVVRVDKLKGRVLVHGTEDKPLEEFRGTPTYVSIFYPNPVIEEVEVPPVDDPETLEILIKKRLSELGIHSELILFYKEVPEARTSSKLLSVHGIPKELYLKVSKKVGNESVKLITASEFSIAGISNVVAPEAKVLHLFADEGRVMSCVSSGGEILYSRVQAIPEYMREQAGGMEGFILENLTMTYSFVAQRQGINIELILLSGKAKEIEPQIENVPVAVPLPGDTFVGLDTESFHELIPPLGVFFIPETYDFSPLELKELKGFERVRDKVFRVLTYLLVIALLALGYTVYGVKNNYDRAIQLKRRALAEAAAVHRGLFNSPQELEYYANYVELIDKVLKETPLTLLTEVPELSSLLRHAVRLSLKSSGGSRSLEVVLAVNLPSISDMNLFVKRVRDSLEKLRDRGISYQITSLRKDIAKKELTMTVRLNKEEMIVP